MKRVSARWLALLGGVATVTCVWVASAADLGDQTGPAAAAAAKFTSPTYSSPIQITTDDKLIWVTNPDNNTVSVLDARTAKLLKQIVVAKEPQCISLTPNNKKAYVTNQANSSVSVIDAVKGRVIRTIKVGSEPFGCATTLDGRKLFVANTGSDTVSVIDTKKDRVIKTITRVGPRPKAIAVVQGPDTTPKVFVTHLQAELRANGRRVDQNEGRDDGKEGRISVFSPINYAPLGTAVVHPIADTGFKSNGSTLDRVPLRNDAQGKPIFDTVTGAFPNLLESIVVKNGNAYLPCTGASPNGPFRFNVNVQGLIAVVDTATDQDANLTINLNKGVQFEDVGKRLFNTNPIAIAFKHNANEGYVVSAATNRLIKVDLDGNGAPTIHAPTQAGDPGAIVRIPVGSNPRGIVINSADTRAFVMNLISRDVSFVDIATGSPTENKEIARVQTASLPAASSLAGIVHRGHELFVTSIGPEGTLDDAKAPAGRMSDFGWGTCWSCHADGLADGVTWMFPDGPRQTISMEGTAEHPQPAAARVNGNGAPVLPGFHQRVLNWSAVRDEVTDFELNIRAVSGGQGLIALPDGSQDPAVFNLVIPPGNPAPANKATTTGRSRDLDAIAAFVAFGIRTPHTPINLKDPTIKKGRNLFARANCQSCHGGPSWTRGIVNFTPPPAGTEINAGQLQRFLRDVGTFNPNAFNEIKANQAANTPSNGTLGINVPSLLGVHFSAPYLHSGQARTLDEVLLNVAHRSAGTNGTDTLSNPSDRAKLVVFLKSIDGRTVPFP